MTPRSLPSLVLVLSLAGAIATQASEGGPFAEPDMAPASQARCEELRSVTEDVEDGEKRLDLSVAGALTLVRSDGVLTYLGFCSPPHPRVLCVTYSDGDMKVGDVAVATGGYGRPDEDHILLDPCMAAPAGGPAR